MTIALPTCPRCEMPYADPIGCSYTADEIGPVRYGSEVDPRCTEPLCTDCGVARGGKHHEFCTKAECPTCRGQWTWCRATDCEVAA